MMVYSDIAHTGLQIMAALAGCTIVAAFVGMDRAVASRSRLWYRQGHYQSATRSLFRWTWIACYASIVLMAALLSLLIGA